MNDNKVKYYIVYRYYGNEKMFYGWTNVKSFVDDLLRNSRDCYQIDILEFHPSTAEYNFIDYMLDVIKIDASNINDFKIRIMNTKSGNQVLTCKREFDNMLSETDCVYESMEKIINATSCLITLTPYVYEKIYPFIVYLKMNYVDELREIFDRGYMDDIHNSPIDVIYVMMTEGLLLEV